MEGKKIEVKKVVITIGKQNVELSLEEIKELKGVLDELLDQKQYIYYPYTYPFSYPYTITVTNEPYTISTSGTWSGKYNDTSGVFYISQSDSKTIN